MKKDPLWFLGEESDDGEIQIGSVAIIVRTEENGHLWNVQELNGNRKTQISYDGDGNMLFNGEFVYTEEFMVIVGMLDEVEETETGVAVFVGDEMFK